jgi:hypothetical protein
MKLSLRFIDMTLFCETVPRVFIPSASFSMITQQAFKRTNEVGTVLKAYIRKHRFNASEGVFMSVVVLRPRAHPLQIPHHLRVLCQAMMLQGFIQRRRERSQSVLMRSLYVGNHVDHRCVLCLRVSAQTLHSSSSVIFKLRFFTCAIESWEP